MTLNFNFNGHRPLNFLFIRDKSRNKKNKDVRYTRI